MMNIKHFSVILASIIAVAPTRSAASTPCTDSPSDKFYWYTREKDDTDVFRTCNWLANVAKKGQVTNACGVTESAKDGTPPAQVVCRAACGICGSASPTAAPTVTAAPTTCSETASDIFFWRRQKGKEQFRKCSWLEGIVRKRRARICRSTATAPSNGTPPAKDVCKVTCGICSTAAPVSTAHPTTVAPTTSAPITVAPTTSAPATDTPTFSPCFEFSWNSFYWYTKNDGTDKKEKCGFVQRLKESGKFDRVANICANTKSGQDGTPPAREVCRFTCDTCPKHPSAVPSISTTPTSSHPSAVPSISAAPTISVAPSEAPTSCVESEDPSDLYFSRGVNREELFFTCGWLQKHPEAVAWHCSFFNDGRSYNGTLAARDMCTISCGIKKCLSAPPSTAAPTMTVAPTASIAPTACTEIGSNEFYWYTKGKDDTDVKKTCDWLAKVAKEQQVTNACAVNKSGQDGTPPARDVCKITCDTCSIHPSGVPSISTAPTISVAPTAAPTPACFENPSDVYWATDYVGNGRFFTCGWLQQQESFLIEIECWNFEFLFHNATSVAKNECKETCGQCG